MISDVFYDQTIKYNSDAENKLTENLPLSKEGIDEFVKRLLKETYGYDYEITRSGCDYHSDDFKTRLINYNLMAGESVYASVTISSDRIHLYSNRYRKEWYMDEDGHKEYDLMPYDSFELSKEDRQRQFHKDLNVELSLGFLKDCFEAIDKKEIPDRKICKELWDNIYKAERQNNFSMLFEANYKMAEFEDRTKGKALDAYNVLEKTVRNTMFFNRKLFGFSRETYVFKTEGDKYSLLVPLAESVTSKDGTKGTQYSFVTAIEGRVTETMRALPEQTVHYSKNKKKDKENQDRLIKLCEADVFIPQLKEMLDKSPITDAKEINRDMLEVKPSEEAYIFTQPDLLFKGVSVSEEAKAEFEDELLCRDDYNPEKPDEKIRERIELEYFMDIISETAADGSLWGEISLNENGEVEIIIRGEDYRLDFTDKPLKLTDTEKDLIMQEVGDKIKESVEREDAGELF